MQGNQSSTGNERMGSSQSQMSNGSTMSDVNYDLVSALYHYRQAMQTFKRYQQDAGKSGDQEVAQLFQQLLNDAQQASTRLEQMISKRVKSGSWK